MKNIILILTICIFKSINAQTYSTVKSLENMGGVEQGIYYKDFNNVLNDFEGTYEYNGSDFYFKIKLEKKEQQNNNNYWWTDVLNGSYQYIKNGVEVNYLNDILSSNTIARVNVSTFRDADEIYLFCEECLNEKWLTGYISDRVNQRVATLFIAKRIVNGEVGLQLGFRFDWSRETQNAAHLPSEDFFVKKIN